MKSNNSNNVFFMIDYQWEHPDKTDIYWGMCDVEDKYNTAICLNQNGFKQFLSAIDNGNGLVLSDVQNNRSWSGKSYPEKYPCAVQLFSHFEGSMTYLNVKYEYEIYVTEIENYYGYLTLKLKDGKFFYGIESDDNFVRNYIEIPKQLFIELLKRADEKSKTYHIGVVPPYPTS